MFKSIKNKIIFAIVISIICSISNITGISAAYAATWTGNVATCFTYGSGTVLNPYQIRNESEYAYFLQNINSGITYDGIYFKLVNNIDVSEGNLTNPTGTFNGTFDGDGHIIRSSVPFVSVIGENATVRLLIYRGVGTIGGELLCKTNNGTVDSCSFYGDAYVVSRDTALLCCVNKGNILNLSVVGSISASREGSLNVSGVVNQNAGTIDNVYGSVKISGSAHGGYSSCTRKAFAYENTGIIKNCYYDKTVCNLASSLAAPLITDELKSVAFIEKINTSNPSILSDWSVDTRNINGGYPIIIKNIKIEETVSMSYNSNGIFTYHATSFSTKFDLSSNRSCTIYYTTDGTNPKTSSTRKKYSGYYVTINDDTTVKSVAYYNGTYGRICTQNAISLPGEGTEANPYKINSKLGLFAVQFEPDKCYSLETDLDFSDGKYVNAVGSEVENWIPISKFSGTFDGNYHSITDISGIQGGLFDVNSGTVENLRLLNHRLCIKNGGTFGSIANYNSGKILRCYSSINPVDTPVSSAVGFVIGGIVGSNHDGTISYCYSTGDLRMFSSIDYSLNYIGGIAGQGGYINSCYSDVDIVTPYSNHDLGCVVGGMGGQSSKSTDCRFDGSITAKTYDAFIGIGSASFPYNETRDTVRCFNGGFTLHHDGKTNMNNGNDSYKTSYSYGDFFESSFPLFDFYDTWMITSKGPMPQGIMNADGKCLYRRAYTEPNCNSDGKTIYKDQYGNLTTDVLEKLPHALNKGVCTRSGCNYKEVYKIDLKYNNEIITSEFEADKNRKYQFTADVVPTDVSNEKLKWTSSDEAVATVSQNGLVSAVGVGDCIITAAASNNVKAELNVKVTETPYLNKIKVSDESAIVGSELKKSVFFATDNDVSFAYCVLKYPSSVKLKKIVPIDFAFVEKEDEYTENGYTILILSCLYSETENIIKYHTFKPFELMFDVEKNSDTGTFAIELTDESCLVGNETHKFEERLSGILEIKPKLAEKVEISGESSISSPAQYMAEVTPEYTSDKGVTWSVDKPEIATVDENGIVTPVTSGTIILTAVAVDGSGARNTKTIEIVKHAESIEIIGESEITEESKYSVVILPEYTTDKNAKWSVSDETVATVDENGTVTPLKNGKIVLTATATDASGISTTKSIVITVSVRANALTSDIGVWDKEFNSDTTEYTVYVPVSSTHISITSKFADASAKINGSLMANNIAKRIALDTGNKTLELILTPLSGNSLKTNTYKINVVKFEGTQTTVSEDKKSFTVKPINIEIGKTVILALYDGDKFVETQASIYNGSSITFTTDKTFTAAKIMVWTNLDNILPICDAEILN